jgi:hypothetical protein
MSLHKRYFLGSAAADSRRAQILQFRTLPSMVTLDRCSEACTFLGDSRPMPGLCAPVVDPGHLLIVARDRCKQDWQIAPVGL